MVFDKLIEEILQLCVYVLRQDNMPDESYHILSVLIDPLDIVHDGAKKTLAQLLIFALEELHEQRNHPITHRPSLFLQCRRYQVLGSKLNETLNTHGPRIHMEHRVVLFHYVHQLCGQEL